MSNFAALCMYQLDIFLVFCSFDLTTALSGELKDKHNLVTYGGFIIANVSVCDSIE